MLFNSYEFILLFLPIVVTGHFMANRLVSLAAGKYWLVLASIFFYAWWNVNYVLLLLGTVMVNYVIGSWLSSEGSNWRGTTA